jgi:hypothetical protein
MSILYMGCMKFVCRKVLSKLNTSKSSNTFSYIHKQTCKTRTTNPKAKWGNNS